MHTSLHRNSLHRGEQRQWLRRVKGSKIFLVCKRNQRRKFLLRNKFWHRKSICVLIYITSYIFCFSPQFDGGGVNVGRRHIWFDSHCCCFLHSPPKQFWYLFGFVDKQNTCTTLFSYANIQYRIERCTLHYFHTWTHCMSLYFFSFHLNSFRKFHKIVFCMLFLFGWTIIWQRYFTA